MLLHFVAVPTTETIELRRKHSAYKFSWQNPWRKNARSRRCSPAPAPAILLSVPKASWEIFVKRLRDKPVHHFFQLLKFVAQFFRDDSDFIILALKESRISSFFKSHTLFLRIKIFCLSTGGRIVFQSCPSSFPVVETIHMRENIT